MLSGIWPIPINNSSQSIGKDKSQRQMDRKKYFGIKIVLFWMTIAVILFIGINISYYFEKRTILKALPQDSTFVYAKQFVNLEDNYIVPIINIYGKDSIDYNYCGHDSLERKLISCYTMNLRGLPEQLGLAEAWPNARTVADQDALELSKRFPCYGLKKQTPWFSNPWYYEKQKIGWEIRVNHLTKMSWDEIIIYPYQIILKDNQIDVNEHVIQEFLDSAFYFFTKDPHSPFSKLIQAHPLDGIYQLDLNAPSTLGYNVIGDASDHTIIESDFKNECEYETTLWNHMRNSSNVKFPCKKANLILSDEIMGKNNQHNFQAVKPILGYWSNDHAIVMLFCRAKMANIHLQFAKAIELNRWASLFVPIFALIFLIIMMELNLAFLGWEKPFFTRLYTYFKLNDFITLSIVAVTLLILSLGVLYDSLNWHNPALREQKLPVCNMDSVYESQKGTCRYFFNSIWLERDWLEREKIKVDISDEFDDGSDINEPLHARVDESSDLPIYIDKHRPIWVEK